MSCKNLASEEISRHVREYQKLYHSECANKGITPADKLEGLEIFYPRSTDEIVNLRLNYGFMLAIYNEAVQQKLTIHIDRHVGSDFIWMYLENGVGYFGHTMPDTENPDEIIVMLEFTDDRYYSSDFLIKEYCANESDTHHIRQALWMTDALDSDADIHKRIRGLLSSTDDLDLVIGQSESIIRTLGLSETQNDAVNACYEHYCRSLSGTAELHKPEPIPAMQWCHLTPEPDDGSIGLWRVNTLIECERRDVLYLEFYQYNIKHSSMRDKFGEDYILYVTGKCGTRLIDSYCSLEEAQEAALADCKKLGKIISTQKKSSETKPLNFQQIDKLSHLPPDQFAWWSASKTVYDCHYTYYISQTPPPITHGYLLQVITWDIANMEDSAKLLGAYETFDNAEDVANTHYYKILLGDEKV